MSLAPPTPAGHQHDDAYDQNWLRVDDTHEVYYEQYGKKDGKPGTCRVMKLFDIDTHLQ